MFYGRSYNVIRSFHQQHLPKLISKNKSSFISPSCCHSYSSNSPEASASIHRHAPTFRQLPALAESRSILSHQGVLNCNIRKRHLSLGSTGTLCQGVKSRKTPTHLKVKALKGGENQLQVNEAEWETVYRFKYIRVARVIQKLKIYQTTFTCGMALPASLACYFYGIVPVDVVAFMLGSSMFACGMLYTMGRFCSRLIGIIYISRSDASLVRIAHLNFWGKREDQFIAKTDFIPFSELPDNVSDIYVNVRFYSEPNTKLHICVRYGTVYNKDEFIEIFGSHTGLEITEHENKPNK